MFEFRKLALHLSIPHQDRRFILVHCEPYPEPTSSIIRLQRYKRNTLEYRGLERYEQLGGRPCRPMKPCNQFLSALYSVRPILYSPVTLGGNNISRSIIEDQSSVKRIVWRTHSITKFYDNAARCNGCRSNKSRRIRWVVRRLLI
jgi:hypothetical protein